MKNHGFISKKKVAREIAYIFYLQFKRDCEAQSALNYLCDRLNIKPMHLNKLGGGTAEMTKEDWEKIRKSEKR